MNTWSTSGPDANRRRSQRVILSVPITVSGDTTEGPFTETTQTLVINAHGALITLATKISQGHFLTLQRGKHAEKQGCRVVYVGPTVDGKTQLGVEFTESAPHFWHITFPPETWTPAAPEKAGKAESNPSKTAKT